MDQLSVIQNFSQKSESEKCEEQTLTEASHLDIHFFNLTTKMFKPEADLFYFEQLIQYVRNTRVLDLEKQSILAFCILFDHDETTNLAVPHALFDINLDNTELIESSIRKFDSSFDIQDFKSTLVKMAVFCSYNFLWEGADVESENVTKQLIDIKYTQNEEVWLLAKVKEVDGAMKSVPISSDILEEFAMVNLGVPLSKHYFAQTTALSMERAWKIFLTQPEFYTLPAAVQIEVKLDRVMSAVAMIYAIADSFETGTEQLRFACGEEDQIYWNEKFHQVFGATELQKVGFFQSTPDLPEFRPDDESNVVLTFMTEASALAKDRVLWGTMMLLIVTKPLEGSSSFHPLSVLNSQFQFVLGRRLRWLFKKNKNGPDWRYFDPNELFAKVMTILKNIDLVANFLQSMATQFQ